MTLQPKINDYASILIVAGQGALRDGLEALLATMSQIKVVGRVENLASALKMVVEQHPAVVVIDPEILLMDETFTLLRRIRIISPETRRLILAETVQQKREVEAPCAEAALVKGASPVELVFTIEKLLAMTPKGRSY